MRSTSPQLIDYINQVRAETDAQLCLANCYLFALANGSQLACTDVDYPVSLNGITYAANGLQVSGLKFKCAIGLDPDEQQITLAAKPSDTIQGVPALAAIAKGMLDGCEVSRFLVFLDKPPVNGQESVLIGAVLLFKGRVGKVDSIGRTRAKITVNSDLILLDLDMPKNLYAPACQHVLFDVGCGLDRDAFTATGVVSPASNNSVVNWADANGAYTQGRITFLSGVNAGISATIKQGNSGNLVLAYPLEVPPDAGDQIAVTQGCDHSMGTCRDKFDNLQNFRGFPFIPPPTFAA